MFFHKVFACLGWISWIELSPRLLWTTISITYLLVGVTVSWQLARRGHRITTAVSSFLCWPLFLGLFGKTPEMQQGPMAIKIRESMQTLREAIANPQSSELGDFSQIEALETALLQADQRLVFVDRMLHEPSSEMNPELQNSRARLKQAHEHAIHEIEAVLAGICQLRMEIAMHLLAGTRVPIQEQLQDLQARMSALSELSSLHQGIV